MLTKGCRATGPGEQDSNHNFTAFLADISHSRDRKGFL